MLYAATHTAILVLDPYVSGRGTGLLMVLVLSVYTIRNSICFQRCATTTTLVVGWS